MTPRDAHQSEAKRFDETADIVEACIAGGDQQLLQQLPFVHTITLAAYQWKTRPFEFTINFNVPMQSMGGKE